MDKTLRCLEYIVQFLHQ